MELKDYWEAVRSGWRLVAAVFAVAIVAGIAVTFLQSPSYTSTTKVFIAARTDSQDPEELYERNQVAAGRVASYAEVVAGDAMATRVSERVGGEEIDPEEDVAAEAVPGTVVLEVAVTADSAERARDLTRAYAELLPTYVEELEAIDGDDDAAQVRLTVVDGAEIPEKASSPDPLRNLVLAALVGLGAGLGVAVLVRVLRRELTGRDEA